MMEVSSSRFVGDHDDAQSNPDDKDWDEEIAENVFNSSKMMVMIMMAVVMKMLVTVIMMVEDFRDVDNIDFFSRLGY